MILAFDAAGTDLSVALAGPDGSLIGERAWTSAQRQSAELLPAALELLGEGGGGLDAVSAVAVGLGPGSFTGLRVALALAKGLAFGLRRPLFGEPSLPAWLEASPGAEAALARAGAGEAYVLARDAGEPRIAPASVVADRFADRPVVAPAELAAALGLGRAVSPRAGSILARRAAARLREGMPGDDLRRLEPIYLRPPRGLDAAPEGEVRWL